MEGEGGTGVWCPWHRCVVVRKDRKAGAQGMAQVGRAPEEVVARPLEDEGREAEVAKSPVLEQREQELPYSGG